LALGACLGLWCAVGLAVSAGESPLTTLAAAAVGHPRLLLTAFLLSGGLGALFGTRGLEQASADEVASRRAAEQEDGAAGRREEGT